MNKPWKFWLTLDITVAVIFGVTFGIAFAWWVGATVALVAFGSVYMAGALCVRGR